jgi:hypothetical protein
MGMMIIRHKVRDYGLWRPDAPCFLQKIPCSPYQGIPPPIGCKFYTRGRWVAIRGNSLYFPNDQGI